MNKNTIKGKYAYLKKEFIPDQNMEFINHKIKSMQFVLSSMTPKIPAIYYDNKEQQYWQCWEYIDHSKELTPVTREYIEEKYPDVDCDDLVKVNYPGPDDPIPDIYIGELKPQKKDSLPPEDIDCQ